MTSCPHFERGLKLKRGVHEVARFGITWIFTGLVLLVPSLMAQQYEQYQARKDQEKLKPNRFLLEETGEGKDVLQRYYQMMLLERGKAKTPQRAGSDEEALLKQLATGVALEGPIDPEHYIVGPFDGISINLWSEVPLTFNTLVTAEGTLIIPTVGEIHVAGHSLKELKEVVAREVRRKYAKGEVGATLVSPRSFVVKVAGIVSNPGAYVVTSADRVDRAIYLANLLSITRVQQPNPLKLIEKEKSQAPFQTEEEQPERQPSLRNIKVYRGNGDTVNVDLIRYYATGDGTYNPYLLDGDIIVVPALNLSANSVSIQGAVRIPGRFEYHPGDSLSLMFKIANGPQAVAALESTELVRFNTDGKTFERRVVDARKVLNGGMDIHLEPSDRVFVRWNRYLREEFNATVAGEVRQPGKYAITRDSTWLSEIVREAGGFTPEAAVSECKILRRTTSDDPLAGNLDYERLMEMRLSGMDREERDYFTYEAAIKRGYVSVDFRKLFVEGNQSADVTLRDGDFIIVPSRNKTVYVFGQVAIPGHVTYVQGSNYRYYIEKAGGFSEAAKKDKVSVIKAGSKKWVSPEETQMEEGDAIFVPLKPERDIAYYFALARDILTVATAGATIYFLIDQVRR